MAHLPRRFAPLLLSLSFLLSASAGLAQGDGPASVQRPEGPVFTDLSQLDARPRRLTPQDPVYPVKLRALGIEGRVDTMFIIETDGTVSDLQIVASNDKRFNAATLKCVATWRYEPARKGGVPVRLRVKVPVIFRLQD